MTNQEAIKYLQQLYPNGGHCWLDEQRIEALGMAIDALQEEPVNEDLEDASNNALDKISKKYDIVNIKSCLEMFRLGAGWQKKQFEKDYTNLCNGIATVKGLAVAMTYNKGVADTKEQMIKNIWKDAQGDDLPEYDREVIAILDYDFGHYKVVYAHRPNPNGWNGTNIDTGEKEYFEPATYGKGGWNQPHILYWLDARLPYEEK